MTVAAPVKEEWAFDVDIDHPVDDFYKRIPQMAYKVMYWLSLFMQIQTFIANVSIF